MFNKLVCMVLFSLFALQAKESLEASPKGLNHSMYLGW